MSNDLPKGMKIEQDLLMRMYTEIAECPWTKLKGLPRGITPKMADSWFKLNGYTKDAKSKIGWSKK